MVIACRSPTNVVGGVTALSGLMGLGCSGTSPMANGVAPAIQISPAESTAAAVAIEAGD